MLANKILNSVAGSTEEKLYVDDVFSTWLYDGNGSNRTITNGIDLAGEGGMVWLKSRSQAVIGFIQDTAQPLINGFPAFLSPSSTNASADSAGNVVREFTAGGFVLGPATNVNNAGDIYASWTFRNAPKFFTHTTVSHTNGTPTNVDLSSLGEVGMVVVKATNITSVWWVWHRSLTAGNNLYLNTTGAQVVGSSNSSVSGTTLTIPAYTSTGTFVIYAWAHDESADGMVQCGSHTGTTATVNLGWEPQFILHKRTDTTSNWFLCDSLRGAVTGDLVGQNQLFANTTGAETSTGATAIRATATGFEYSGSGTSVYLAIRIPNKPPTSGTEVFQPTRYTGTNVDNRLVNTGIKTDMVWLRERNDSIPTGFLVGDRLRGLSSGLRHLLTGSTAAEVLTDDALDRQIVSTTEYGTPFSSMTGVWVGNNATAKVNIDTTSNNHIALAFQRRPGFFDIVCYTGTGVARTVPHQLGVAPELMIIKRRDASSNFTVYAEPVGAGSFLQMQGTNSAVVNSEYWNDTTPTSTVFSLGTQGQVNIVNGAYVAYLFASLPGISKVGSYIGNGTSQTINCGFSTGARFVLIKRTDAVGSWVVFDTARGIVAGNDPYHQVESNNPENSADILDVASSGFIVNEEATRSLNVNAATYIYLAIA